MCVKSLSYMCVCVCVCVCRVLAVERSRLGYVQRPSGYWVTTVPRGGLPNSRFHVCVARHCILAEIGAHARPASTHHASAKAKDAAPA